MNDLARTQDQALVTRAHEVEREIVRGCEALHKAWWHIAKYVHEFHEQRGWELLDYESLDAFLDIPQLPKEFNRRQFFRLSQAYRELCVIRGVPTSALTGIEVSNADAVLPALTKGRVSIEDALDDAREHTVEYLREKYKDPDKPKGKAPENGTEPELRTCPTCGTVVEADKLSEAA